MRTFPLRAYRVSGGVIASSPACSRKDYPGEEVDIKTSFALWLDAMRTTLSIDDDVAAELDRLRRARNAKFKLLVNEALRRGLQAMAAPPKEHKPFRTRPMDLGRCLLDNLDNIAEVLAVAEGEDFR
jgi:hypothetical protein